MIEDEIAKFNLKVEKLSLGKIKSGFMGLSDTIRARTPAETGRLRNNWFPSVNVPSDETTENTGNELESRIKSLKIKLGDTLYLVNNLPYAAKNEFGLYGQKSPKITTNGFSNKAPAGMVRISIVEWRTYFA